MLLKTGNWAALILACLAATTAFCAEDRVRSVTVTGVSGENLTAAQAVLKTRAGDPYSEKTVQEDVLALYKLHFVESAKATRVGAVEGMDVVFELSARGRVEAVHFAGNRKFRAARLLKEAGLEDFAFYDIGRLTEGKNLIIAKYKKAGYLFVKVDFSSQPDGSVLFRIVEGPRLAVVTVNVIGNAAFADAALKKRLATKTRKYLFLPYRFDESVVEEDKFRLADFYRSRGYLDATVEVKLNLTARRKGIIVDYVVTEGALYTVRSTAVSGNAALSAAELQPALKMAAGKPFSADYLGADIRALKSSYGRIGYIDCAVTPSTIFAEDVPQVDVLYRIVEGAPITVGEVEIFGNDKTRDNVIRRDLRFFPGETFNTDGMLESQRSLRRLGYFSKVEIDARDAAAGTTPRDVAVKVEETTTGSFSIGAAVSSDGGLMGNITFSQTNFDYARPARSFKDILDGRAWAGGGQMFQLVLQPGTNWSQMLVNYKDPRVNDSDYSFGFGLHLWEREGETYAEGRTGAELTFGRKFTKYAFWELGLLLDAVDISSVDADAPPEVFGLRGASQVNAVSLTLGHDTRDRYPASTKGHRLTAAVEQAAELLGSDFAFTRYNLDGKWYRTLRRDALDRAHVLSWRARLAYVSPNGTEPVPIFERFFLGGSQDVRGFEYRGLGPKYGDEPLGDKFVGVGGVEYDFPLAAEFLRGALFYDAGTLLDQPGDLKWNEIRHTVGFGIRFIVPPPITMPVKLDFGFPIDRKDEDDTQVLSFGFERTM